MRDGSEEFAGLDVAKARHAVAIAEGGGRARSDTSGEINAELTPVGRRPLDWRVWSPPQHHGRVRCELMRSLDRNDHTRQQLERFRGCLYRNAGSLVDDNIARIAGAQESAAHVESPVNQLVNWRMCKEQQMC